MSEPFSGAAGPRHPHDAQDPPEPSPARATPTPGRTADQTIAQPVARSADRGAGASTAIHDPTADDTRDTRGEEPGAIEAAASALRGRWKLSILWCLGAGPRRFNALAAALPGVTPKVLADQLRELTRDGVVTRRSERSGPKHVEYELSTAGEELWPTLEALHAWGRVWAQRSGPEEDR